MKKEREDSDDKNFEEENLRFSEELRFDNSEYSPHSIAEAVDKAQNFITSTQFGLSEYASSTPPVGCVIG